MHRSRPIHRSRSARPHPLRLAAVCIALLLVPPSVGADGLVVGSGSLFVKDLPNENQLDMLVCANSSTGKLGRCSGSTGQTPSGTAWVAKADTGDYPDPNLAMDDLATWCGTPSATNPCVLKIGPGIYILTETLFMQDHVTVEGSGIGRTVLTWADNDSISMAGVESLSVSAEARLKNLSIVAKDGSENIAVIADHGSSGELILDHVAITARDADSTTGDNVGIRVTSGLVSLHDVQIETDRFGEAYGLQIEGSGMVESDGLQITARSSSSVLKGIDVLPGATLRAVNTEIYVDRSLSTSSGDTTGVELQLDSTSVVLLSDIRIEVISRTDGRGIYAWDVVAGSPAVPRVRNADIDASDSAGTNRAVFTTAGSDIRIENSSILGDEAAFYAATSESEIFVVNTVVDGVADGSASAYTCRAVYLLPSLFELGDDCQVGL